MRLLDWGGHRLAGQGPGRVSLTSSGAVALVADLPQAVEALVDAPEPVLQLHVPAVQHVPLDVAHIRGADDVFLNFCGRGDRTPAEGLPRAAVPEPPGAVTRSPWATRAGGHLRGLALGPLPPPTGAVLATSWQA